MVNKKRSLASVDPRTLADRPKFVEDKSLRKITLEIFERDGNPDAIFYQCHVGRERTLYTLTRSQYYKFFDKVARNKTLTDAVIQNFVAEAVNYLEGADDPISRGDPNMTELQDIFPSQDRTEAHILTLGVIERLADGLFYHFASEGDRKKLQPLVIEFIRDGGYS